MNRDDVTIIGAGMVGPVMALLLHQRGHRVSMHDRRSDPRNIDVGEGRSVNLVISERGWHVLERIGIASKIRTLCVPLRGRTVHLEDGSSVFQPYSRNADTIWCVERPQLHTALIQACADAGILITFDHACVDVDFNDFALGFERKDSRDREWETPSRVIATDGTFSAVRTPLVRTRFNYSQAYLEMGYKEIQIPGMDDGGPELSTESFHVWPREDFFVGAFPNANGSFTASVFMLHEGALSFSALQTAESVHSLFERALPSLHAWHEGMVGDFLRNQSVNLVTIRAQPWSIGGKMCLMGDAAHAIVPFFGQGMNCGFEDALQLVNSLDTFDDDWTKAMGEYETIRRPNSEAIADLSIEHYHQLKSPPKGSQHPMESIVAEAMMNFDPERYMPLYEAVAFTRTPYADVKANEERRRRDLRRILQTPDLESRWEEHGTRILSHIAQDDDDDRSYRIPMYESFVATAMADGIITLDEQVMLDQIAEVLGIPQRARKLL